MYEGLYNVRKGLSPHDRKVVGLLTAKLLVSWDEWHHRRVEEIYFDQDDAATRDISLDFTLPYWFHDVRPTPSDEPKRQLVPLTFLRKRSLINFRLRDDCNCALPLLTRWQNAQVAEAALTVLASKVLRRTDLPDEIRCDIRNLVGAVDSLGRGSVDQLFSRPDPHSDLRSQLAANGTFNALAREFEHNFLACTMMEIGRHCRKVVHLSYEEILIRTEEIPWQKRIVSLARGEERDVFLTVPRASAAESSHVEVVAPDLLQIKARRQATKDRTGDLKEPSPQIVGGHKRAHFHFAGGQSTGSVTVTLIPSTTSHSRMAALASAVSLLAILVALWIAPDLRNGEGSVEAAAAVLLSFTAVAGLFAAIRDGGTNMVQELLWPIQLLSLTPVLWTFLAGLTILAPLGLTETQLCFGALAILDLLCTVQLIATARNVTSPTRSAIVV